MKKAIYSFCLLGLLATVSCKDDNDEAPAPDPDPTPAPAPAPAPEPNTLTYDDRSYEARIGWIEDFGPVSETGEEATHYNYVITVTDFLEEGDDMSFILAADMYSLGNDRFRAGTFSWVDHENYDEEDLNNSIFIAALYIDGNEDGDLEDFATGDDVVLEATGGEITVTGTAPNLTITYEIDFEEGKTLTGTYEGDFEFADIDARKRSSFGKKFSM